jgi:glucose 1-dehydrogenase
VWDDKKPGGLDDRRFFRNQKGYRLAQEVASEKIRVNSIAPGAIKTPINREAWQTEEAEKDLLELIPWKRVGEARDIGTAAVWLASDESEYVHGATLFVDGGMTLYSGFAAGG